MSTQNPPATLSEPVPAPEPAAPPPPGEGLSPVSIFGLAIAAVILAMMIALLSMAQGI